MAIQTVWRKFHFRLQGGLNPFKPPFLLYAMQRWWYNIYKDIIGITLRKIKPTDKKYFATWWRDKELLKLTSGVLKRISDKEVDKYFQNILESQHDYHFIINLNKKTIGHISLTKKRNKWYETQIVIGEKEYWGKGYGSEAIKLLLQKAKRFKISKIYLEVKPTNTRTIRTYQRCGFQKVKMIYYPNNKYLTKTLRMELK